MATEQTPLIHELDVESGLSKKKTCYDFCDFCMEYECMCINTNITEFLITLIPFCLGFGLIMTMILIHR